VETELAETRAADWRRLRDVRLRALAESPDAFGSTLARERGFTEAAWRARAGAPWPTVLAVADGRDVALGGLYVPDGGVPQVWGMWTEPAHRGRGTGAAVLDRLLAWCDRRGGPVLLDVARGNVGARALYVSRGFVATGTTQPLREGSVVLVEEMRREG